MGNCKVERAKLSPGFVPLGVKEYGGIIYIASYNPDTKEEEIGCFPSPERDITGSNKIENQTGLTDGRFTNTNYKLPTSRINGDYLPEALLSKIQKLNEQEVLKLSPGDKYVTTYRLMPVTGSDPITQDNFNDYFSFDEDSKRLFNINFYRVDSDNNVIKIENPIKSVPYKSAMEEDEYVFFTESSGGALAVEIKLNSIDYFSANMREISKKVEQNKKIRVEAIGASTSDLTFEGVRLDVTRNKATSGEEVKIYHLEKTIDTEEKVSATLQDLAAEDTIDCEVTPYTKYGYLADLKQSFFLKLGQDVNTDTVNDVFKWFVNTKNSRLELDFDFKLDTENPFKLFIEFYDTWSNVSTIRTVTNPSIYGPMRLTVDLVSEPRTQVFDTYPNNAGQYGGIPMSKLIESVSINNKPVMIDPVKSNGKLLIRSDNALRKNHFYLVRICGYEEIINDDVVTYVRNDVYRGLYTNVAFNDIYTEQASLTELNPEYQPNFNEIPYPKDRIKLTAEKSKTETQLVVTGPVTTEDPVEIPKTEYKGNLQLFSLSARPASNRVILNSYYTAKKNYTLFLNRNDDYIYNSLKNGVIEVLTGAQTIPLKPENIIDVDKDTNIPMRSTGTITIPALNVDEEVFNVELQLNTQRPSRGSVVNTPPILTPTPVYLHTKMYQPEWSNSNYPTAMTLFRGKSDDRGDVDAAIDHSDIQAYYSINDRNISSKRIKYNGVDLTAVSGNSLINKVDQWYEDSLMDANFFTVGYITRFMNLEPNGASETTNNLSDYHGIIFMTKGNYPSIINIPVLKGGSDHFNIKIAKILSSLYYDEYTNAPTTGYYVPRDTYVHYDQNSESRFVNMSFRIKTGWLPQTSKKYIFRAYNKSLGFVTDFNTDHLNDTIRAAIARESSNVLNGELKDNNFIPFVDEKSVYPDSEYLINLSDESIKKGTDPEQIRLLSSSQDSFESRLQELNNIDLKVSRPIQIAMTWPPVVGLDYKRREDFAKMFKYDPIKGSLVFDSNAEYSLNMVATIKKRKNTAIFNSTDKIELT